VLFTDWTLLRLFPPLRAAWAPVGLSREVLITGQNAKRVLFGAINLHTGHRIVLIRARAGGADARAFLMELRRRYRSRGTIWLLLDRASSHTDRQTQALAQRLRIQFLWLPKQAPELNAMDQLWRELKRVVAANRQAKTIDALAAAAALWVLLLTPTEARRKAGLMSRHFWLRKRNRFANRAVGAGVSRNLASPAAGRWSRPSISNSTSPSTTITSSSVSWT
jgi:transposase